MSYTETIEDIHNLPKFRDYTCRHCGHHQQAYVLLIQSECEKCGTCSKLRAYTAIGAEIEDVIDAVLHWLGQGDDFEAAMNRKRIMDAQDE